MRQKPVEFPLRLAAIRPVFGAFLATAAAFANGAPQPGPASTHWAFQPIAHPAPPEVANEAWVRNPIDRFILRKLEDEGMTPSPEADRATLIRRLHLDLLGLPPAPEDVDAFVNDDAPWAYERLVNRLLASPHFGERWGRYWLDLARYADSDGFEKDTVRPHAWRYRHWVIDAINRDLPYDQFVIEQLAGDLLPQPTLEQLVATGFHRNTLTNKEGGVDEEEFRVEAVVDRVNTTGAVFMGLTFACAQCHDHKYDPITTSEYYGLFAFFNSADEKDIPAPLAEEAALYERRVRDFESRASSLRKEIRERRAALRAKPETWEPALKAAAGQVAWTLLEPASMASAGGATFEKLEDGSILVGGNNPIVDTFSVIVPTPLSGITAIRLEVLTHESLPKTGPGRAPHGNFILSEFRAESRPLDNPNSATPIKFASAWTDFFEKGFPIEKAIDGDTATGWSIDAWRGLNESRNAVFITEEDVGREGGQVLAFTFDHQYGRSHAIGRFRLYAATGPREHALVPRAVVEAIRADADTRTPEQWDALLAYAGSQDPALRELEAELEGLEKARPSLNVTQAQTLFERPDPRPTHIHLRGNFMNKGDEVSARTPAILPPLECRSDRPTRLDLARWLVSPEHPLTARVAANRIWQGLFGAGLVLTSEDFGTRGEPPSHPELLDWLASEYMARGWSRKDLIRLIVQSATYRQSSATRPELLERDANNRLLWAQNRQRVEAEIVRDLFLSTSGLLNPVVGGPSVRPPLPEGVAELGYANSITWDESNGDAKYRRGIYILFQRTVPYPMLMAFDCPDSNVTAIRRARSNTPLQALTLLNDPVFFECAQALGKRACGFAGSDAEKLARLFRVCLGRAPEDRELSALLALLEDHAKAAAGAPWAAEVAGADLPEGATPETIAPWVLVARAVMNLDEFVTRE